MALSSRDHAARSSPVGTRHTWALRSPPVVSTKSALGLNTIWWTCCGSGMELPRVLAPITEGRADIAIGSRFAGDNNRGALPWHQWFGNRLAASLITLLYGVKLSDLGPFRAARAEVLHALALEEATYGWAVEMILKGALAGFRIVEVPVSYYPRIGKSKISGTVKGTLGAAWFILSLILRYYFRRPGAGRSRPASLR